MEIVSAIYGAVLENPGIRAGKIAALLNVPRSQITRTLPNMQRRGYLLSEYNNRLFAFRNLHEPKRKGKPAQFEKPMKRKEVMLPDEAIEFFLALGEGNLSAGVRMAWRSLTKRAADERESARKKITVK